MFEGINVKVKKEINNVKDRGKVEILRPIKKGEKIFSDESSSSSVSEEENNNNDNILPNRLIRKTEIIETKEINNKNINSINSNIPSNNILNINNIQPNNIQHKNEHDKSDNSSISSIIDEDLENLDDEYKPTIENIENIALTKYNKIQSQREQSLYKKYVNNSDESNSDSENNSPNPPPKTILKAKFIPQNPKTSPPPEQANPSSNNTETFNYLLKVTQSKPKDISLEALLPSYESVDDTDDMNDIVEYEKWKIRELKRIKRSLEESELKYKEDQELKHRRTLTDEQVKSENLKLGSDDTIRLFKSKINYLQKYYHKGAFFQDESQLNEDHIYNRDYNLPTWEDNIDRSKLPKIMNKRRGNLFKKGQSKYTHLSNEDTTNFDPMFKVPENIAKGLLKKTGGYK